jgi:HAD superfamily hydrolase (TIGR01509 family)
VNPSPSRLLFIFDMDDVLYDYDWRARMAGMTAITGHSLRELRRLWWHDEGEWAAEAGVYATPEAYFEAFQSAIGMRMDESEWVRIRGAAMRPRPESIAAVRRASELGDVTLLTNNGALTAKHLRTLAPALVPVFGEHLFTSSDYGARKPDPLVFERVLERYGRAASEAFFVDDMPVNVAGAASIGITAHLYHSPAKLLAAIEQFAAERG